MKWIELKQCEGPKIHINVEQVSSLEEAEGGNTVVCFLAGEPEGKVRVEGTPEDIIRKIKAADNI